MAMITWGLKAAQCREQPQQDGQATKWYHHLPKIVDASSPSASWALSAWKEEQKEGWRTKLAFTNRAHVQEAGPVHRGLWLKVVQQ